MRMSPSWLLGLGAFCTLMAPAAPTLLLTTLFLAVKGGLLAGKISVAGLLLLLLGLLSPIGKRSTDSQRLTRSTRDSILQHISLLDPLRCIQRMVCEISSVGNSTALGEYEKFVGSLFSPDSKEDSSAPSTWIDEQEKKTKLKTALEEEEEEESALEVSLDSQSLEDIFLSSEEAAKKQRKKTKKEPSEEVYEEEDSSSEEDLTEPGFHDFDDFKRSFLQPKKRKRKPKREVRMRMLSFGDLLDMVGSKQGCRGPSEGCSQEEESEEQRLERIKQLESFLLGRNVEDMEDTWRRRRKRKAAPESSFRFRLAAFLGKLTGSRRKCRTFFNTCPFSAEEIASMVRNLHDLLRKHPNLGKLSTSTLARQVANNVTTTTTKPSFLPTDNEVISTTTASANDLPKRDSGHLRRDRP